MKNWSFDTCVCRMRHKFDSSGAAAELAAQRISAAIQGKLAAQRITTVIQGAAAKLAAQRISAANQGIVFFRPILQLSNSRFLRNEILRIIWENAIAEQLVGVEMAGDFHGFVDVVFFSDVINAYRMAVFVLKDFIE